MLIPEHVATTVSTAFRNSVASTASAHPSAWRSAAVLEAARQAVADLVNGDPRGVVLGADRAVLLSSLAGASSSRAGLGYEIVVTRLDDEANIAPWLRAANRFGAKIKWAEVDIETGELPNWQWESLIGRSTRLIAVTSASGTLGTVTELRTLTKLIHDVGGLVVVDHSAAAPYRLLDIEEADVDVVAVNAVAWGGPPIGALVFRDPALINSFASVSTNPNATGRRASRWACTSTVCSPVWSPASNTWPHSTNPLGYQTSKAGVLNGIGQLIHEPSFRLPDGVAAVVAAGDGDRPAEIRIPVVSFAVHEVPAERVVQRLADNGSWRSRTPARGCSTSSGSTTSAARSPSDWRTTRRPPRSTSWCARSPLWGEQTQNRTIRCPNVRFCVCSRYRVSTILPATRPEDSNWCASAAF
ncbi:aminotransferase class-V family protein [Mycobacterium xenopi 3993]|nr:aminotransferase class-V family protein [Mycobacterium xenopi 3993]